MGTTLVIGGTKGLGRELAERFEQEGIDGQVDDRIIVTGRTDPGDLPPRLEFQALRLDGQSRKRLRRFVEEQPDINRLVVAAGFEQETPFPDLRVEEIDAMLDVCLRAPLFILHALLRRQGKLGELLVVTSTSEETPRALEIVYCAGKAGISHATRSLAETGLIEHVFVAEPAGMKGAFWHRKPDRDLSTYLEQPWVADKIMAERNGARYKKIRVLRNPPRVELVEEV